MSWIYLLEDLKIMSQFFLSAKYFGFNKTLLFIFKNYYWS